MAGRLHGFLVVNMAVLASAVPPAAAPNARNTVSISASGEQAPASSNGEVAKTATTLNSDVDLDARDETGLTELHRAVMNGDVKVAKKLLKRGASLGAVVPGSGATALHLAAFHGNAALAQMLLQHGAAVGATDTEEAATALHVAASNGHTQVVRVLISYGAALEAQDTDGLTALYVAAREGHAEVVHALCQGGADVNIIDRGRASALHMATVMRHADVVHVLLNCGADSAVRDADGDTALHHAAMAGYTEMIHALLQGGAKLLPTVIHGITPFDTAVGQFRRYPKEALEVIRTFLNAGASATMAHPWNGMTPLQAAKSLGADEVVDILLAHGAVEDSRSYLLEGDSLEHHAQVRECNGEELQADALRTEAHAAYAAAVRLAPTSNSAYLRLGTVLARLEEGGVSPSRLASAPAIPASAPTTPAAADVSHGMADSPDDSLAMFRAAWRVQPRGNEDENAFAQTQRRMALTGMTKGYANGAQTVEELSVAEVDAPGATERAVRLWREQGVVAFPSLINASIVDGMREYALAALLDDSALNPDIRVGLREGGKEGEFRKIRPMRVGPIRDMLASLASLEPFLNGAFQNPRQMVLECAVIKTSSGAHGQEWHRDTDSVDPFDDRYAAVQISLVDTEADQGVLEIEPATQRCDGPEYLRPSYGHAPVRQVKMAVPKGTVVFYSPSVMHRGSNHTLLNEDRLIITVTLMTPDVRMPSDGMTFGIPNTIFLEDAGRWWLENRSVFEVSHHSST